MMSAEYKNLVWSYDFTMSATEDGRRIKMMPLIDEFARECHTLEVERSITAKDVIATLDYLFRVHGEPESIRIDNGPKFIVIAVRTWLKAAWCGHPPHQARKRLGERSRRVI